MCGAAGPGKRTLFTWVTDLDEIIDNPVPWFKGEWGQVTMVSFLGMGAKGAGAEMGTQSSV